ALPVQSILFDYTLPTTFTGGFAVAGVTVFGFNAPLSQFGLQAQFSDIEHLEGKAPGTYTAQIDLVGATNPLDFTPGQSFNQIFTDNVAPAANQLTPAGFQIFFNKSSDQPLTVYIDNVRLAVPEPASIGTLAVAAGLMLARRR